MKRLAYLLAMAGIALMIVLVVRTGYRNILDLLALAGWNLFWLIPYHVVPVTLDAQGWRTLIKPCDPHGRVRLPVLVWIALVREGVGRLLPVASVGGDIVGIRLLILRGLEGAAAAASVVVEVILSLTSQYLFTATCVVVLITILDTNAFTSDWLIAMAITFPLPLMLLLVLGKGRIFQRFERFAERLLGGRPRLKTLIEGGADLDTAIGALIARRGRLVLNVFWQFAGMVAGSLEVWFALRLLGHPVSPAAAIALESVTLTIRYLAFLVPVGLGVQEAGLMAFGEVLGLGPDTALTLSLIKRMRELLVGVPALISWQIVEGWHWRVTGRD